jgi:KDO2-lipid IV(A) lauroyltransferase
VTVARWRARWKDLRLAPDGLPRPEAPLGRGPLAARVLAKVIDGATVVGCRLPPQVAHGLAVAGGTAEWAVRLDKRRRLAANLAHAVERPADDPLVRRLVRREIVNEARRSADLLWALGRQREFLASTEIEGLEHVHAALAHGRGMVLAGIHLGGWEVATAVPGAVVPVPTTAIVADDWLAWAIEHMRVTAGLRVLYRSVSPLRAARLLRDGEALLVLADDGAGHDPRSIPVRFLDGSALMPAGVVTLARLAGSPVVSFYVLPLGPRRWRVLIDPPVDAPPRRGGEEEERRTLQVLADRWSEVIRAYPEHWAAVYRVRWVKEAREQGA